MALTQERATKLRDFLNADAARAEKLAVLEPAEAAKEINAEGYDFTAEEIIEFGEAVVKASSGELDTDALDDVAGGSATAVTLAVTLITVIASVLTSVMASRKW